MGSVETHPLIEKYGEGQFSGELAPKDQEQVKSPEVANAYHSGDKAAELGIKQLESHSKIANELQTTYLPQVEGSSPDEINAMASKFVENLKKTNPEAGLLEVQNAFGLLEKDLQEEEQIREKIGTADPARASRRKQFSDRVKELLTQ